MSSPEKGPGGARMDRLQGFVASDRRLYSNGLTAAARMHAEVNRRKTEEYQPPTFSVGTATGSKRKIKIPRPCGKCNKMLNEGDSFRLRRFGVGRPRACHVSC